MTSAMITRAALAVLTNEDLRKGVGWVLAAVLSPFILLVTFLCCLGFGTAEQNVSVVELCFYGGTVPNEYSEEYRTYIEDMQTSFGILDGYLEEISEQIEDGDSLDVIRVKAIFYALYFGADAPSARAHRKFADCFVTYEERTRTVVAEDDEGNEVETEETYAVAIPIGDPEEVYAQIISALGVDITEEQRSNTDSIYNLVRYGRGVGAGWSGEIGDIVMSVDGFISPLGTLWQERVTSEFGYRTCPYHGWELHSGLDMAAPTGMPIRAALAGVVTKSSYSGSYGNYTMIDHGNGLTTAYAHQSQRLVSVGDVVEAGQVIGLVGSTGNSTGPHLHLEVRVNGNLQNPRNYLP